MHLGSRLFVLVIMIIASGCNSIALEVDELHVVELEARTPYLESNADRYTLVLFAPSIPESILSMASNGSQAALLNYEVAPFELRSQAFENDFEMNLLLDRLVAVEPGQVVDLYFEIENTFGYFELHATVEFY